MTSPTIQFDIPDDEDREIGVVAWFTMGIHVPEFGGTVGVRVRCREWLRGRG